METAKALYEIKVKNIMGIEQSLRDYKGKVLLIVNTASKCGFTKQYDGLQRLYDKYKDRGLEILGFPANNFMYQEPGNDETILNFCRVNFGVNFPLFSKISVRGKNIDPLYKYLTDKETNPKFGGKITWNFNKFLISRDGEIIDRFDSKTEPEDPKVISALEQALA